MNSGINNRHSKTECTRTFDLKGNFVLLLHRAAILSNAHEKRLVLSVKQLNIKSGKWEKLF